MAFSAVAVDDGRSFNDRLAFLREVDAALADELARAGQIAHDDRRSALIVLRSFAENVVRQYLVPNAPKVRGRQQDLAVLITQARKSHAFPAEVVDTLDLFRDAGNHGAHPTYRSDVPNDIIDLLRRAWRVAEWLYAWKGGDPAKVPSFEPPTAADGNAVFRDAVLGGPQGHGDPKAKYYVANAILAQHEGIMRERRGQTFMFVDRSKEVMRLLREAAHEMPAARSQIAELLMMKESPGEDGVEDGMHMLEWAEEAEDGNGLFLLGYIYLEGLHGRQADVVRAAGYFDRAATQEEPRAFNALAMLYRDGKGVLKDPELARDCARRSAEAGFPIGQHQYGSFLLEGFGGPADKAAGLVWIRRAIRQDWPDAMFHLAMLLIDGDADPGPGEDGEAMLDAACEGGSADARIWRADRELGRDDGTADFSQAFNDLAFALEDPRTATKEKAQLKLAAAHRRLDAYLRSLPRSSKRRQDLSAVWFYFTADGKPKARNQMEFVSNLMARDKGSNGESRLSDEAMLNMYRMQAGPGVTPVEEAMYLIEMKRRLLSREVRPSRIADSQVPRVGRNDPCPCGSGTKYKKCHGN